MISNVGSMSYDNAAMMQQFRENMFAKVDQNGDGSINKDEMQLMADRMSQRTGMTRDVETDFATADLNGDGKIDKSEFLQFKPTKPVNAPSFSEGSAPESEQTDMIQTLLNALIDSDAKSSLNILA